MQLGTLADALGQIRGGTYTARRENVLEGIMRKGDEKKTDSDMEREREKKSR